MKGKAYDHVGIADFAGYDADHIIWDAPGSIRRRRHFNTG
jgi:hypothetical protein